MSQILISYCGQCDCGCYDLVHHPSNPPERAFSIGNTTGTVYLSAERLEAFVAEAAADDITLITRDPAAPPAREFFVRNQTGWVYLNADDRADLIARAASGELQTLLLQALQPAA